ncbi:MAG: damage-inducible protein CinA, partial [Pedobacter sp.]
GTVWIALAGRGKVSARIFKFGNRRIQNIERSAIAALTMIVNDLNQD